MEICKFYRRSGSSNRGFKYKFVQNLTKNSSGESNIFIKNRFDLLYQENSQEKVITETNIESEKLTNINKHQTPFKIKSGTGNTRRPNLCTTEKHI